MSDYEVGYGKPPKDGRFKKGVSANPKGRPKRQPPDVGEVVKDVLDSSVEFREGGRKKKAPRREVAIKRHLERALEGDIASAAALLKIRALGQRFGGKSGLKVEISGWLPEEPGRTGRRNADFELNGAQAGRPKSSDGDQTGGKT
jgi:Family of unknown function (DUF5681)